MFPALCTSSFSRFTVGLAKRREKRRQASPVRQERRPEVRLSIRHSSLVYSGLSWIVSRGVVVIASLEPIIDSAFGHRE